MSLNPATTKIKHTNRQLTIDCVQLIIRTLVNHMRARFCANRLRVCISPWIMAAVIVGLTGLLAASQPALATTGKTTNLTIPHTNDTHAHLDNVPCRATKIDQIRNEVGDDSLLLLDAGDVFHGTLYFTLYQ